MVHTQEGDWGRDGDSVEAMPAGEWFCIVVCCTPGMLSACWAKRRSRSGGASKSVTVTTALTQGKSLAESGKHLTKIERKAEPLLQTTKPAAPNN